MSRAEKLQAALAALNVEMIAKLGLEPGDDWTDFDRFRRETSAWRRHDRLAGALAALTAGTRSVPPS